MKGQKYAVQGILENTDYVMNNTFWLGVQPALTQEMLTYVCDQIDAFMKEYG
jgi:CDP-6-deoxy-D-xylo-4-hexulose-3-dehydrase